MALDDDPATTIGLLAPDGVDRVVGVSFSADVDLDARIAANGAVIAAFATRDNRPTLPFWPMLFANVVVRLLGSDDFPAEVKQAAARDLTAAAAQGALSVPVGEVLPLERVAAAHRLLERGRPAGRVLLSIP